MALRGSGLAEAAGTRPPAVNADGEGEFTSAQISAYYAVLSRLLGRLENSRTTHYEALGVERSETLEQIKRAYLQTVYLLYPPYTMSATVPGQLQAKIESAFQRASAAFAELASFAKRARYDKQVCAGTQSESDSNGGASALSPAEQKPVGPAPESEDQINLARQPSQRKAYRTFLAGSSDDDRRRVSRMKLSVPARITGYDRQGGKWSEMATTIDVSRTGITVGMKRRVRAGAVLYVTIPLPAKLRNHGFTDSGYNVYCLVRRTEPSKKGVRGVGLEFLGEHPPAGFLDKPWATFQSTSWSGANRRRKPRREQSEIVVVEYFDESMQSISREMARTDNLSDRGTQICVRTPPADFDLARVVCPSRGFESFATLRSRFRGKDGFERLCLQFTDNE